LDSLVTKLVKLCDFYGTDTSDVSLTDICSLPLDIHRYCQKLSVLGPLSSAAVTTGTVKLTFGGD